MEEIYKDIQRINRLDPVSPILRLAKLFEEVGEFARAINMKLGRKSTTLSDEEILEEIKEEAADTIQCLFSFIDSFEIDFKHFKEEFLENSHISEELIPEITLAKIFKYIGYISHRLENNILDINLFIQCVSEVLTLASYYGVKESEVIAKISEKNIKWEKVIKNKNLK